jgi:phosphatidylglycerol lysyltransferase
MMEHIILGGQRQWIRVQGNPQGPLLLYLHGGPGTAELATADWFLTHLQPSFQVINWDQPGAGKTGGQPETLEQFLSNARELADLLRARHPARPLLLMGHSWGSFLGLLLLQQHPKSFDGFISVGQLVAGAENEVLSHELALKQARRWPLRLIHHALLLERPPYGSNAHALVRKCLYLYLLGGFFKRRSTALPLMYALLTSPHYTLAGKFSYLNQFRRSLRVLQPAIETIDLLETDLSLQVPVLFCIGRHDLVTPPQLAERLFEHLQAPHKQLVMFDDEAHCLHYENPRKFAQVVLAWLQNVQNVAHPPSAAQHAPGSVMTLEQQRARGIVLSHGWNATAYQLLNPGMHYWFSEEHEAVVGYTRRAGVRVVAGAPITLQEHLADVAAAFEQDAARTGETVCYFCADARLASLYERHPRYARLLVGGQPVWNPQHWPELSETRKSLRAQLKRARNKGVRVTAWSSEKAHRHPALEALLDTWLKSKRLPALGFLVEPRTLSFLHDRRVFVAEQHGRPVGFLVASPVPARQGWLVEQIVRHPQAPNGTAELLVDAAARAAATEGSRYFTLGLVPLAQPFMDQPTSNPLWLRLTLRWVRAHGQRFYNFSGLEYFKSKFSPHRWDPIYAITNESTFSVRTLYAVAAAFSDGSPFTLVASALGKAARQELAWQWQRLRD